MYSGKVILVRYDDGLGIDRARTLNEIMSQISHLGALATYFNEILP